MSTLEDVISDSLFGARRKVDFQLLWKPGSSHWYWMPKL